jgi:preprotein translocase subunit SecF
MAKGISPNFEVVANHSVVEIMGRCLNTSITTMIAILALLLFVGGAIQNFVWVLLIGVVVGAFDSICIAPSLLVVFETGKWGKFVQPAPTSK